MNQRYNNNIPPVQPMSGYLLTNTMPPVSHWQQGPSFTGYSSVNMMQKRHSYPPAVWIPQDMWNNNFNSPHNLTPHNYALFPVEAPRRWSETAATNVRTDDEVRRWSMHPPEIRPDYSRPNYSYLLTERVWAPENGEWFALPYNSESPPEDEAGMEEPCITSSTVDMPATVAQILNFLWTDEDKAEEMEKTKIEEPVYITCVKRLPDLASLQEED